LHRSIFLTFTHTNLSVEQTADDFDNIIKYKQTCLTDNMFKVIESKGDGALSFGEFVEVSCVDLT